MRQNLRNQVENLLADVDRQISAVQAVPQVLAVSPSLQNGDFPAFDRQMRAALKVHGTSIVLHNTTGQQLLSTNRPFGETLPRATNTEMHDRVVATGQPQISDLIIGAVLRRPILVMGVPVFRAWAGRLRSGNGAWPGGVIVAAGGATSSGRLDGWHLGPQRHYRGPQPNWIAFLASRFRQP